MARVAKFFAYWEIKDKTIDVFEALELRDKGKIVTDKYEQAELLDIYTNERVFPNKRVNPYFSYYPDKMPSEDNTPDEFNFTPERIVFLRTFEHKKQYKIRGGWGDDDEVISITAEQIIKLERISSNDGVQKFYIVDIFLNLKETRPFSYYYEWNGNLALEFLTTSKTKPYKSLELGKQGIQIFEVIATFPKDIQKNLPNNFKSEEVLSGLVNELNATYDRNYRLHGRFINKATIHPDYKEKFKIMRDFEEQCKEMEQKIARLKEENGKILANKDILSAEKERIEKEIEILVIELKEYQEKNEYYQKIESDNKQLTNDNKQITDKNNEFQSENNILIKSKKNLERISLGLGIVLVGVIATIAYLILK